MPNKNDVHVAQQGDKWAVKEEGSQRATSTHRTQSACQSKTARLASDLTRRPKRCGLSGRRTARLTSADANVVRGPGQRRLLVPPEPEGGARAPPSNARVSQELSRYAGCPIVSPLA